MVAWVFSLLTTGSCFMVRSYGVTGSPGIVQYRQPQLSVTVCRVRGFWSSLFTQPCPVLTIYCVISWSGLWCICLDLLFSLLWYCGAVVLYNYISESHVSSVHVNVSHYPRVTDTIVADTRLSSVTIMVLVHTEDHRLCTLTGATLWSGGVI